MSVKEHLKEEIERLDEDQLLEIEDFLSFLKFRSLINRPSPISQEQIARLYSESGEEDRLMAEQGMADFSFGLVREDKL